MFTEDQLRLLLDQQSETEILDYKSELDLVDMAKIRFLERNTARSLGEPFRVALG